jgi:hypothetical protein
MPLALSTAISPANTRLASTLLSHPQFPHRQDAGSKKAQPGHRGKPASQPLTGWLH